MYTKQILLVVVLVGILLVLASVTKAPSRPATLNNSQNNIQEESIFDDRGLLRNDQNPNMPFNTTTEDDDDGTADQGPGDR